MERWNYGSLTSSKVERGVWFGLIVEIYSCSCPSSLLGAKITSVMRSEYELLFWESVYSNYGFFIVLV